MGRVKLLLVIGCLFSMIPAFFEQSGLWLLLSILGYGIFGLLFWNDGSRRREVTWVMYALMLFSAFVGLDFWHRLFRVGFWMSMLFSEVLPKVREKFWYLQIGLFFIWGMSFVFSISSWQWWIGLVDGLSWFLLAVLVIFSEKAELSDEL